MKFVGLALVALFVLCAPSMAQAQTFKATITWADNSTNEDGFKIERSDTNPGVTWSQVGQVATDVVSFVDQPLAAGGTFCWRVRAFNAAGNSAPGPAACANTPTLPDAPGTTQIVITIASSGPEGDAAAKKAAKKPVAKPAQPTPKP